MSCRHEILDGSPDELATVIAEQLLDPGVDDEDPAVFIGEQHPVRRRLDHGPGIERVDLTVLVAGGLGVCLPH